MATKRATILISLVVRLIRVKPVALAELILAPMVAEELELVVTLAPHHHLLLVEALVAADPVLQDTHGIRWLMNGEIIVGNGLFKAYMYLILTV